MLHSQQAHLLPDRGESTFQQDDCCSIEGRQAYAAQHHVYSYRLKALHVKKILIIDDDSYICNLLVKYLEQNGYRAEGTIDGKKGMQLIEKQKFDLVLCDFRLPDTDGLKILQHVKLKRPATPVVIMTAYADIKMAVTLIKAGAFDYVTKPIQPEEIQQIVKRAIAAREEKDLTAGLHRDFVVGTSARIRDVMNHVSAVAPTDITVLIEGETGSGKEYIARAIHNASKRKGKPFVAVDCGAIPKELANSELFGHIKGAFTGAIQDKKGVFELAKGGTLFLDEVGNLSYEIQAKLLRAIQERIVSKVGENRHIKVDVRLITATNEDLLHKIAENEFREDLYHRINGFKISLPALRERIEDIHEFTNLFIKQANKSFQKNISGIDETVERIFRQYPWHGNIRELQNIVNRAVLLSQDSLIHEDVLPDEIRFNHMQGNAMNRPANNSKRGTLTELKEATEVTEKEVIAKALIQSKFNKSRAAKLLNIDRKTLYNKIKLYNIEVSE